jgi:heat shock protein HslJ
MNGNALGLFQRYSVTTLAPVMLLLAACASAPYREPARPAAPDLAGTHWTVTSIDGRDTLDRTELTADFGVDGRINGNSGCNRFSGPYVQTGNTVSFGEVLSTRRACTEADRQRQEDRLLGVLRGATTAQLVRGELQLRGRGGSVTLMPSTSTSAAYVAEPYSAPLAGRSVRYECQGIVIDVQYGERIARVQAPDSYDELVLQRSDSGPVRYESAHSELRFRDRDMLWGREGAPPRSCVERR